MGHLKTSKESCFFAVKMINTILGLKKEMSAKFDQHGRRIPVTNIVAKPNIVLTKQDDKVQLGFGQKKKVKKTENAYVKVAGYAPRFVKEVPASEYSPGDTVSVSIFAPGDLVKITGTTRGKGFAGVVKRWGFAGGPKTHGQSDRHRAPGSIGQTTTPGRVFKGKKMAGHMGASQLTVRNLEVVDVDIDKNLLLVKGSVPGSQNGLLIIEKIGKAKASVVPSPPKAATTEITEKAHESTEEESVSSVVAKEEKTPEVKQNA